MHRVSGVSPPIVLRAFNSDIKTLERAVKERVFFVKREGKFVPPPVPKPGDFERTIRGTFELLKPLLPKTAPSSRREFVESFKGRKKARYEKAFQSLLRDKLCDKDCRPQVFVKYEKTNFTKKVDPVPRVISARDPRYNIEVGRYLRPLEKRIFKAIDNMFGHTTVMKGFNSADTARYLREKWDKFTDPVAIPLDAVRFDQHVSEDALIFEHKVYTYCFPRRRHRRQLGWLLSKQRVNKCEGYTEDGRLRYKVRGKRMSGDMNTSLGACLIMCSMNKQYLDDIGVNGALANNGDDCIVFMERKDLSTFMSTLSSWFLRMGFNMEVGDVCYEFEQIEFCQTKPIFVGPLAKDFVMIRDPLWGLGKDTMCLAPITSDGMAKGWLHAVGSGGLSMCGGIPVFQEFYASYIKNGKRGKDNWEFATWGRKKLEEGMAREYGVVTPHTRASFYYAFGITPDEQIALENYYRKMEIRIDSRKEVEISFQAPMPCMLV